MLKSVLLNPGLNIKSTLYERLRDNSEVHDIVDYFRDKASLLQTLEVDLPIMQQFAIEHAKLYGADVSDDLLTEMISDSGVDSNLLNSDSRVEADLALLAELHRRALEYDDNPAWNENDATKPLGDRRIRDTFFSSDDSSQKSESLSAEAQIYFDNQTKVRHLLESYLLNKRPNGDQIQKLQKTMVKRSLSNPFDMVLFTGEEAWRRSKDNGVSDILWKWYRSDGDRLGFSFQYVTKLNRMGFQILDLGDFMTTRAYKEVSPFDYIWGNLAVRTENSVPVGDGIHTKVRDESKALEEALNPDNAETRKAQQYINRKISHIEGMYVPEKFITHIANRYGAHENDLSDWNPEEEHSSLNPQIDMTHYKQLLKNKFMKNGRIDSGYIHLNESDRSNYYSEVYNEVKSLDGETYSITQVYFHRPSRSFDGEKVEAFLEVQNTAPGKEHNKMLFKFEEGERNKDGTSTFEIEYYIRGKTLEYHIDMFENVDWEQAIKVPEKIRDFLADEHNRYQTAPLYRQVLGWMKETIV